jgi:hypothetical protein
MPILKETSMRICDKILEKNYTTGVSTVPNIGARP